MDNSINENLNVLNQNLIFGPLKGEMSCVPQIVLNVTLPPDSYINSDVGRKLVPIAATN